MTTYISMFLAVFLAELGDKTQLATVTFASGGTPWRVFAVAASALVASTGLAVAVGHLAGRHLEGLPLPLIAGACFIALGVWTIAGHFRTA